MKQTAGIFIFSILLSSVSFAHCPDLTGTWKCTSSDGEKWTDEISMSSPTTYEFVSDKGTPNEEKETLHADGRVITESLQLKKATVSMLEKVENFITNYLPKMKQIYVIGDRLKNSKFEPAQQNSTFQMSCQNNEALARYQVNANGSLSSMMQLKVDAAGVLKISINKSGKQIRLFGESVAVAGHSSIGLLKQIIKDSDMPQRTTTSSFVICEK